MMIAIIEVISETEMLEIKGLKYSIYDKQILRGVDLCVRRGELVVLTGPNGGGKSTLAELVMGLRRPDAGRILLNSENITNKSIVERAKLGMAYAFQRPVQIKGVDVKNLLGIAARDRDITQYLKMVGLTPDDYMNREFGAGLSGGELKRLEIASVLAREADFMIFDEPEAGIDLWSFKNLTEMFRKLHRAGKTMMIISHQEKVLKMADRVVVMRNGMTVESDVRSMIDEVRA